ncbi:MAG: hypothetical protein HQ582_30830, partial [Planctomycetes bacterium]|nr:hypothetical protein [Planctomycetota bacterium]
MRPLPPLAAGPSPPILPMADRSAVALMDVILADDAAPTDSLSEQLAVDPPLVLWAVCTAASADGFRPRSIDDVSAWLGQHLLEVLRWDDPDRKAFGAPPGPEADRCADQVAYVLQVAELAALLAAAADQTMAEEAFLLGMLHDAADWPTLNALDASRPLSACLPQWLDAVDQEGAAAQQVREAARILAGESTSAPSDFDPEACRQRAAEARRSWLEPVGGGLVDRLPVLTARLTRLAQLEHGFQEVLDTEKLEAMAEFSAGAGHEIN